MALNVNIIGRDSEGNLRALKVNSEGNLELGQLETEIQAVKDNQGRLYGKYGEAWIPVKVDSEGRPIIESDVTVNAEGMVVDLGQIKQGPAGTEPWPVQLSGANVEFISDVLAVTDTSTKNRYISISGFQRVFIYLLNTLKDASGIPVSLNAVSVRCATVSAGAPTRAFDGEAWKDQSTMLEGNIAPYLLNTMWPWISDMVEQQINIRYNASTTPTSGSVSIFVGGVPNVAKSS